MSDPVDLTPVANGADVVLQSGAPASPSASAGAIRFVVGGEERLRIDPGGGFYVDGRHVTDDLLVYRAFLGFLASCRKDPKPTKSPEIPLEPPVSEGGRLVCTVCEKPIGDGMGYVKDGCLGGPRHVSGSPACR